MSFAETDESFGIFCRAGDCDENGLNGRDGQDMLLLITGYLKEKIDCGTA
jgi:hypothetical protein